MFNQNGCPLSKFQVQETKGQFHETVVVGVMVKHQNKRVGVGVEMEDIWANLFPVYIFFFPI